MTLNEDATNALLATAPASPWVRSSRGNLTRVVGKLRVTVFYRHGRFWCCAADETDVYYLADSYRTEAEAKAAAMHSLEAEVNDGNC